MTLALLNVRPVVEIVQATCLFREFARVEWQPLAYRDVTGLDKATQMMRATRCKQQR